MMLMRYICALLFVIPALTVQAQPVYTYTGDTLRFEKFTGEEKFQYTIDQDSLPVKNGKYNFESRVFLKTDSNQMFAQKLRIDGGYKNDRRDGNYTFSFGEYEFELVDIKDVSAFSLNHETNGYRRQYKMNYASGIPDGRWQVVRTPLKSGRFQRPVTEVSVRFFKGVVIDHFSAQLNSGGDHPATVKGQVNASGFFDGNLYIQYERSGAEVSEVRTYDDGYLVELLKTDQSTKDTLVYIEYNDVKERLATCRDDQAEDNKFTISDEGFGVPFDNGYMRFDRRRREQKHGNEKLERVFGIFDDFHDSADYDAEPPKFLLTRRFKYIYPPEDDSLAGDLYVEANAKQQQLQSFLDAPRFIIAKERSDSMALAYAFIEKSAQKNAAVLDAAEKVKSGYFDFLNRDTYYRRGVPELKEADSVVYVYDDKENTEAFDPGYYITGPDSLLPRLILYFNNLQNYTQKQIEFGERQIIKFEQQDIIDSIDTQVVKYRRLLDSLYADYAEVEDPDKQPIDYRMFKNIEKEQIRPGYKSYVKEDKFEPKQKTGVELACLLKTLYHESSRARKTQEFPDKLEKMFTEFRRNPFDNRQLESKFLGGISRAGKILLRHYVENMFTTSSCEDYSNNLDKAYTLMERLEDKAANKEREDVLRLNRGLRRETVPSRIERLMNI